MTLPLLSDAAPGLAGATSVGVARAVVRKHRFSRDQQLAILESVERNYALYPSRYTELVIKEMQAKFPGMEINSACVRKIKFRASEAFKHDGAVTSSRRDSQTAAHEAAQSLRYTHCVIKDMKEKYPELELNMGQIRKIKFRTLGNLSNSKPAQKAAEEQGEGPGHGMFGDMELVRNAQQDAPTFRRVSLDLQQGQNPSLRRLSTASSISSTTTSTSQASSPAFSSSMPSTHGFWPDKMSGLFRTGSLPQHQQQPSRLSPIKGTPDSKVPALIRSLSKGMDSFR
eukprot:gene13235-13365_t